MTTETTPTAARKTKRAAKAKPAAKATAGKPAKADAKSKRGKATPKADAGNPAHRPRGEKWEATRKLLSAKGGADRASLFQALKWRSMDQNLLAARTGMTITKNEDGTYSGTAAPTE